MNLPEEKGYQKLKIYQKAKDLVLLVYQLTKGFPKEERYVLVPQIRRAAISIVANIGEGYARTSTKEFIRFINIAVSSLIELEIYSHLINNLRYVSSTESKKLQDSILEMKRLLYSSKYSLEKRVKR